MDTKWSEDTMLLLMGVSVLVAIGISYSAAWLWEWKNSPVKNWLLITPLYMIKTDLDLVRYWPIWTVSEIRATHNHHNGSYKNTSLSMKLDGVAHSFVLSQKRTYGELIEKLRLFDKKFRAAANVGNMEYLVGQDDFVLHRFAKESPNPHSVKRHTKLKFFTSAMAACAVIWFISVNINNSRPMAEAPYRQPYVSEAPISVPLEEPRIAVPSYVRPKTSSNGQAWPVKSSYVSGYKILHADGLSSVTIDNSRNNSDVFVKLVSIDSAKAFPVRQFFVNAFGTFIVNKVRAGNYDVRYKDLDLGSISKSEPFELTEIPTNDGVEYSTMSMTLYKIQNGNMETTTIPESEF